MFNKIRSGTGEHTFLRGTLIGLVLVPLIAMSTATLSGAATNKPDLIVSYFSNAYYAGVVASQPSLHDKIPAKVDFVEVTSGPATLAGMKTGHFDMTTQTGNPPIATAIGKNSPVQVIWAEAYTNSALVLSNSIKRITQMAGKKFGTLVGSSEDFSFVSWLKVHKLANKVTLVDLTRSSMVAAFKTGAIAGGYNDIPFTTQMIAEGGHLVTTATKIAKLGYPSINMLTVDTQYAKEHPAAVQGYVCADAAAYKTMTGHDKRSVLSKAAAFLGLPAATGLKGGLSYPLFKPSSELTTSALGLPGKPADSAVEKTLFLTGAFLKTQGLLTVPPTKKQIVAHIDQKFAEGVAHGKCK